MQLADLTFMHMGALISVSWLIKERGEAGRRKGREGAESAGKGLF